jgi:hypothetical protein
VLSGAASLGHGWTIDTGDGNLSINLDGDPKMVVYKEIDQAGGMLWTKEHKFFNDRFARVGDKVALASHSVPDTPLYICRPEDIPGFPEENNEYAHFYGTGINATTTLVLEKNFIPQQPVLADSPRTWP